MMKSISGVALVSVCLSGLFGPSFVQAADVRQSVGGNALIMEMRKLDEVFRDIVSAVAVDDTARVRKAVASMHGYREKTHEAVHHGAIKLPKNGNRMHEFIGQDERFHAKLDDLEKSAEKNDQQAMVTITQQLLDGCVQCHRTFRNP